jgi:hypothetical protein
VDCWIGIAQEDGRRVVRLAGRLCDVQVPELRRACEGRSTAVLDLTDLLAADAAGIEAIRTIRRSGAVLVGTHGYIQLKLDTPTVETAE